jgi:hypothetical protein
MLLITVMLFGGIVMRDFVTSTNRCDEYTFFGSIAMSFNYRGGAKEALNAISCETYEHDLPHYCFACGLNEGNGWKWEVKTYINRILICKVDSPEEASEVMDAINDGYSKWEAACRQENKEKMDRIVDNMWF